VLWPSVLGAVDVVVAEVPWVAGLDQLVASPAVDGAVGYERCPLASESVVLGVVPT